MPPQPAGVACSQAERGAWRWGWTDAAAWDRVVQGKTRGGGEAVTLRITATVSEDIQSPSIGFYIKDRLGQVLCGDNTGLVGVPMQKIEIRTAA